MHPAEHSADAKISMLPLILAVLCAVLPVLAVPFMGIDATLQKGMLALTLTGGSLIALALVLAFSDRKFEAPWRLALLVGGPLAVVGAVSALQAKSFSTAWWGNVTELGTVGSLLLFAFFAVIGALVPRKYASLPLIAFMIAVAVAVLHALVTFFSAPAMLPHALIAGTWPEFSFLIAGALVAAAVFGDWEQNRERRLIFTIVTLVFAFGFVFFFHPVAALIAASVFPLSVALFYHRFSPAPHIPVLSISLTVLMAGALFFGMRSSPFIPLPGDVRPSLSAMIAVIEPEYVSTIARPLIGSGPDSFVKAWTRYRPVSFNDSSVWNFVFPSGWSFAMTLAVELGIAGIVAFFYSAILLAIPLVERVVRREEGARIVALTALTAFFFIALSVHPVGLTVFLMTGLASGLLARLAVRPVPARHGPASAPVRIALAFVLCLAGGAFLWISAHQFIAAVYHERGMALTAADPAAASLILERSTMIWSASSYHEDTYRAALAAASAAAHAGDADAFTAVIKRAKSHADEAVNQDVQSPSAWMVRASLYLSIIPLGDTDAPAFVRDSLQQLAPLAPTDPQIPYLEALLAVSENDTVGAEKAVQASLALNHDYAPALQLLGKINQAQGPR